MGLENSISEMIERQDELSNKALDAQNRFEEHMGRTSPGLQPIIGRLPNQCGIDSNGDGLPDGWLLPANGGFTSWELAGSTTTGFGTNIVPGSLEEEFHAGIPAPNGGLEVRYRNHAINFWRFSWDLSAGGAPDQLKVFDQAGTPLSGMAAAWVKEEVPGILDHVQNNARIYRGSNNWAIWSSEHNPIHRYNYPGNYAHPNLSLKSADIPVQGSLLIAGPQVIPTRIPVDVVGWSIFPGLNREVVGDSYEYSLVHATNAWESK